ncbi:putative RNA-directed DNA polymerase from transposon X-element, partial [Stegodyphus mimosarum]
MISYLEDRTFQVRCGDALSTHKNIHRGLPQGSVISPANVNLCASDMPKPQNAKILKYADDTGLTFVSTGVAIPRYPSPSGDHLLDETGVTILEPQ